MEIMDEGAVEIMEEGADARAGGKDAAHEATTHARPAAAAPVPPEVSVAAILEVGTATIFCSWAGRHSEESESRP